jgi:hypothetical protein
MEDVNSYLNNGCSFYIFHKKNHLRSLRSGFGWFSNSIFLALDGTKIHLEGGPKHPESLAIT